MTFPGAAQSSAAPDKAPPDKAAAAMEDFYYASGGEKFERFWELLKLSLHTQPESVAPLIRQQQTWINSLKPLQQTMIEGALCWAQIELSQLQEAREQCNAALQDSLQIGSQENTARLYNALGLIAQEMGEDAQALRNFELSVAASGEPEDQAAAHINAGVLLKYRGAYERAFEHFAQVLEQSQNPAVEFDSKIRCYYAAPVYAEIGDIHRRMGDLDSALEQQQLALECAEQSDTRRDQVQSRSLLITTHLQRGEVSEASKLSIEAEQLAATSNLPFLQGIAAAARAAVLLQQGALEEAETAARLAIDRADNNSFNSIPKTQARVTLAQVLAQQGDYATALAILQSEDQRLKDLARSDAREMVLKAQADILNELSGPSQAFAVLKDYLELIRTNLRVNTTQRMALLQTLLDADRERAAATLAQHRQQLAEANALRANRTRNLGLLIGLLLLIVGYLIASRMLQLRAAKNAKQARLDLEDELTRRTVALRMETESKAQVEADLLQAQKLDGIGQLTSGVAHDFNNLMSVVLGNTELVLGSTDSTLSESDRQQLQHVYAAAESAGEITSQLLAFARKQRLVPQPTNITQFMQRIQPMLDRAMGDRLVVIADTPGLDVWCEVDAAQLGTAMLNLALNARDAMNESGIVRLRCRIECVQRSSAQLADGQYCRIDVIDKGRGISADQLERVIEPFFTTKPSGQGNGLGLSMVYGFAKQSSGTFKLDSSLGSGTIASIYLPLCAEPEPAKPAVATVPDLSAESTALKVFVVEDQERVRDLAVQMLRKLGYEVEATSEGANAYTLLSSGFRPDLLFSDVSMPGEWDGVRLAQWVHLNAPEVGVLLTSGFAQDILDDTEFNFLRKPYSVGELQEALSTALSQNTLSRRT